MSLARRRALSRPGIKEPIPDRSSTTVCAGGYHNLGGRTFRETHPEWVNAVQPLRDPVELRDQERLELFPSLGLRTFRPGVEGQIPGKEGADRKGERSDEHVEWVVPGSGGRVLITEYEVHPRVSMTSSIPTPKVLLEPSG